MQASLQKKTRIKILPAISFKENLRLRGTDIDEAVKNVQGVLPDNADEDTQVTITLLEKNLQTIADPVFMKEVLTRLVKNAMPGCDGSPLTINHVNFEIESLLDSEDFVVGGCAFIPLTGIGTYVCVDEKIKEKILEPFFTTITADNSLRLAMAYRMVKQQPHGAEVNIYLPLTKVEIVNMMSIPIG